MVLLKRTSKFVAHAFDQVPLIGERSHKSKRKGKERKRGQCGLVRPRVLAGVSPAWVIVSHEPSIEPCGASGNRRVGA